MTLNGKQKNQLRGLAHKLKPVVLIGAKGLSQAVLDEIAEQLTIHELIKVKMPGGETAQRQLMISTICEQCNTEWVQSIGHITVFYRAFEAPVIKLI